jgi:hypothetical protein
MRLDSVASAGTLSLRWKGNDSISWTFTKMTTPGFSSQSGSGKSTADSLHVDYTVVFSTGGNAVGVMDLKKVSATWVDDPREGLPAGYALSANYPNPFNPTTHIRFTVPTDEQVRITVYSVAGDVVAILADGRYTQGDHDVVFDGSGLASGVYYYRLATPSFSKTRKMVLVK